MTMSENVQQLQLSTRQERILRFVVEQYVTTGSPVGSRTLSKMGDEHLSPASIRNTLADLEDMQLVEQPHTSAGRVPTDRGYRFYVDRLMRPDSLPLAEQEEIRSSLGSIDGFVSSVFPTASSLLSHYSHYIGIVATPAVESMVFNHIQFVRQGPGRILIIFVARTGIVHNKLLTVDGDFSQDLLDKASRWLNDHFRNMPLARVKERIEAMLLQERARYDLLMRNALLISRRGLEGTFESEGVYIEGTSNLMRDPRFAPAERLEEILSAIERKSALVELLSGVLDADGVQVVIGSEAELREINNCSLVAAAYRLPDGSRGGVAVLGPRSMQYSRTVFLVDFISRQISTITS